MGADRRAGRYIAVEGPIGVGKTALARRLATEFGSRARPRASRRQPVPEEILRGSRAPCPPDPALLHPRALPPAAASSAQRGVGAAGGVVADYLFAKDGIFAGVTLKPDELALYRQIFQLLDAQIPRPDLVIYLEARPDVLLRRIRKRDRDFERGITPEYLERLTEAFRTFFHHYTEAPLLVINCSDIDFVEHGGDLADLIKEVRGMKQGVQHYIPLGSS